MNFATMLTGVGIALVGSLTFNIAVWAIGFALAIGGGTDISPTRSDT